MELLPDGMMRSLRRRRSKRTEEKPVRGGKKKPGTSDAGKRPQKCVIL